MSGGAASSYDVLQATRSIRRHAYTQTPTVKGGPLTVVSILLVLVLQSSSAAQEPRRIDQTGLPADKPVYRKPGKGEAVIEGLLQRVECPRGQPVRFTLRVKDQVERFEAAQLGDVEYIAHTPDFKGPMSCGGRGKGDRVRLTWKKAGERRRVVAVEFLPAK